MGVRGVDRARLLRPRRRPARDGGSLTELLASGGQGAVRRAREELVFDFPNYQGDTPHSAIRLGDMKLLYFYEDQALRLFDLSQDVGERRDLSEERVEDARRLRDRLMSSKGQSSAVAGQGLPAGMKSVAISLWHFAPDQEKSYWGVYGISADVEQLKQNARGGGTLEVNDKRRAEYDSMCSKGSGQKTYRVTVYVLSASVKLSAEKASQANLLAAIKDVALAEGTLDFV